MVSAIFSINTGRSGSHYLAHLMSFAANCESHHESQPNGFGQPLIEYHRGNPALMEGIAAKKIEQVNAAKASGKIFADTNHCFIKGFAEPLLAHLPASEVGLIFLTREKQKIVDSTFQVFSLPLTARGRKYIFTPERKDPIVPPPSFAGVPGRAGYALARLTRFFLAGGRRLFRMLTRRQTPVRHLEAYQKACIQWYIEESYALGEALRRRHPEVRCFEVRLEDLNNPDVVLELFNTFGLEPTAALWDEVGKPTNLKLLERS